MRPDEEVRRGAAALGVPAENLPAEDTEGKVDIDVMKVWIINWPAVLLFLALETQWRVVSRGMGGVLQWLGIDYAAAGVLLSTRSRSEQRRRPAARMLEDLREMEREALTIMNEVRE